MEHNMTNQNSRVENKVEDRMENLSENKKERNLTEFR